MNVNFIFQSFKLVLSYNVHAYENVFIGILCAKFKSVIHRLDTSVILRHMAYIHWNIM